MKKNILAAAVLFFLIPLFSNAQDIKSTSKNIYDRYGRYEGRVTMNKYTTNVYNRNGQLITRTNNRGGLTYGRNGRYLGRNYHYQYKYQQSKSYRRQSQVKYRSNSSGARYVYRYQYQK